MWPLADCWQGAGAPRPVPGCIAPFGDPVAGRGQRSTWLRAAGLVFSVAYFGRFRSTVLTGRNPTATTPPPADVETQPGDLREMATVPAAFYALRRAVDRSDPGCRKDAAEAAWHALSVVRFFCASLGGGNAGVRVSEDGFIAITAEIPTTTCSNQASRRRPRHLCVAGSPRGMRISRPQRRMPGRSNRPLKRRWPLRCLAGSFSGRFSPTHSF